MGLFSKPSAPAVPNYQNVSGQQTNLNIGAAHDTQKLNSTNQVNQFGSLDYNYDPNTGQYKATQQYTPEQQALFNTLQGTQHIAGQQGQDLLHTANYGADPNISGNAQSQAEKLIAQQMQLLRPQQDYQRSIQDINLRNQGLTPGTPGYDQQMRMFDAKFNDFNAANAAQFQGQAYNQAMENYQLPAQMSQSLAQFGAPGNIMQNLWNTPTTQVAPSNIIGAAANMNQANMERYKQEMANRDAMMRGITGMAAGGIGLMTGNPMPMMSGLFGGGFTNQGPGLFGVAQGNTMPQSTFDRLFQNTPQDPRYAS